MTTRSLYKALTALLWLAPTAIAIRTLQVWDRLPVQMATHFDAANRPNGWMTREISLYWSVGFLSLVTAVFCVVLYVVQRKYALAKLSWVLLAFFHLELWIVAYMLNSMLNFNLNGASMVTAPLLLVSTLGAMGIVAVALAENRGARLSAADVLAEEVHSGKAWSALFIVPLAVIGAVAWTVPTAGARFGMSVVGLLMIAALAMAWDGFHYYFSRHGVEIRTLGFRLKSIPLLQIKSYAIAGWNPIGGFGIRGIGNHKAYVWGRSGVRVEMYDGEIFLGHSDPQRIVHDLNVIERYRQS
jgi:Protein of unknown function (DUF1648)